MEKRLQAEKEAIRKLFFEVHKSMEAKKAQTMEPTTSTPANPRSRSQEDIGTTLPRRSVSYAPISPEVSQEFTWRGSRIVRIRRKDYDVRFNGEEVERFIRRFEEIAEIEGANGSDKARQVLFFAQGDDLKEEIEDMEGYEERDWENIH